MKTSFLPRPAKMIRPAPNKPDPGPDTKQEFRPRWQEPVVREFVSEYTAFPQAPDPNAHLAEDLEQFYRTK